MLRESDPGVERVRVQDLCPGDMTSLGRVTRIEAYEGPLDIWPDGAVLVHCDTGLSFTADLDDYELRRGVS